MRDNAWAAIAIVGVIIAFALSASGGGSGGGLIDVEQDGAPIVNNTAILDFQTPLTVTDDSGDADIGIDVNDCDAADSALTFSVGPDTFGCNTISAGGIDVELNGTTAVTGAEVMDFLSPFNVTDDAGDAQISLPLADDNIFIGNGSSVPIATPITNCDNPFEAITYGTTGNVVACHEIPPVYQMDLPIANPWAVPGWQCSAMVQNVMAPFQNDLLLAPIVSPFTTTYTQIGIRVNIAGGAGTVARIGIYDSEVQAGGFAPGDLVLDAGTVSIATAGTKTIAINETLTGGHVYFLALVHDDATNIRMLGCDAASGADGPAQGIKDALDNDPLSEMIFIVTNQGIGALPDPAPAADSVTGGENGTAVNLRQ